MPTKHDIAIQFATDSAVRKRLMDGGDDERAVHTIDHQLLAETPEALTSAIAAATALAFKATAITPVEIEGKPRMYSCYLQTPSRTVLPLLTRQSILMVAIAEAFGCTYNGWGTKLVKKVPGPASPAAEQ